VQLGDVSGISTARDDAEYGWKAGGRSDVPVTYELLPWGLWSLVIVLWMRLRQSAIKLFCRSSALV